MGAVIGSGWLFSSFDAAQIGGGGGAVTAWILGVSLILVLALVHAELGTMFPVDGGTARFPLYAFGRVTGFFSGWFAWISAVCVPAIETEAALRYLGNYAPSLISQSPGVVRLTPLGQIVAAFVLLGFTALNAAGMRSFRETNTVVVWWKIAIPLIVAIAFVIHGFDRHNFAVGGLFPAGRTACWRLSALEASSSPCWDSSKQWSWVARRNIPNATFPGPSSAQS